MKTLKIFLASSNELETEREMMAALANSLNTVLERQSVNVIVVQWENLDASMGVNHKQDDYNEKLRECDMCMVLYWTKFGMYTKIELETAFNELKAGHNPKKVYVYFKEDDSKVSDELKGFRDSFPTEYGHFYTPFSNFDTLKAHFLLQFMEYLGQTIKDSNFAEIRNGKVVIDGKEYVDINKIPFAGNNEEYNELKDEIIELQEDLEDMSPDSPRYAKKAEKLLKLKEKMQAMESSLWDTALMITRLSTTNCSERLERAMQLFNKGDNKGASAILNEYEIDRDVKHNLQLVKLGEEGRKGLMMNLKEYELKAGAVESEMSTGWEEELLNLRVKILDLTRFLYGDTALETIEAIKKLAVEYEWNERYPDAIGLYQSLRELYNSNYSDCDKELAAVIGYIGYWYYKMADYKQAEEYTMEALRLTPKASESQLAENYGQLADIYDKENRYEDALRNLELEIAIRERLESTNGMAYYYREIASTSQKAKDYVKAIYYYQKEQVIREIAIEKLSDKEGHKRAIADEISRTTTICHILSDLYHRIHEPDKSLEYSLKELELKEVMMGEQHDDCLSLRYQIATTCIALKKYEQAETLFLPCYKNGLYYSCLYLGALYERGLGVQQDYARAIKMYETAAEHGYDKAWSRLPYVYLRRGMTEEALDAFCKAITFEPSNVDYMYEKAKILFDLGRYDDAKAAWMEVVKLDPDFAEKVDSALFKGLKSKGLI